MAPTAFPTELSFLLPFLRKLSKLSSADDYGSVDTTGLEKALRKRIRGLSVNEAAEKLVQDRRAIETWLASFAADNHPAHDVVAFLSGSGRRLAGALLEEPPVLLKGPPIHCDPPPGWRLQVDPFSLNVRKGRLLAGIMPIDKSDAEGFIQENRCLVQHEQGFEEIEVHFGEVVGKKFVKQRVQIDYVLTVPGGWVSIQLFASGKQIKLELESEFESSLHTIRITSSGRDTT